MHQPRRDAIQWTADDRFWLDDVSFWLTTTEYHVPSTPDRFVLLKNKAFHESYQTTLSGIDARHVMEVGFFHGGSTALLDLLLRPERLVCVDHVLEAPMLERYMRSHDRQAVVPYSESIKATEMRSMPCCGASFAIATSTS